MHLNHVHSHGFPFVFGAFELLPHAPQTPATNIAVASIQRGATLRKRIRDISRCQAMTDQGGGSKPVSWTCWVPKHWDFTGWMSCFGGKVFWVPGPRTNVSIDF